MQMYSVSRKFKISKFVAGIIYDDTQRVDNNNQAH